MLFAALSDIIFSEDDARAKVLVAGNDGIFIIVTEVLDDVPTSLGQVPS